MFFGFSDNTHLANHLWLQGVPSYYGGSVMTQFAMQGSMEAYTIEYLKKALFGGGMEVIKPSSVYNDILLDWDDPSRLTLSREYEKSDVWLWSGTEGATGYTWGGCLESVDELLRNHRPIPTLEQCEEIILCLETSEEMPSSNYARRVIRALGELGMLERIRGAVIGRSVAWSFANPMTSTQKRQYREELSSAILEEIRRYNTNIPVVQGVDFGHTNPQICLPYGRRMTIDTQAKEIAVEF